MASLLYQKRLHKFMNEVTLYPVCCEKLCCGRTDKEWLASVIAGGAKIVQLRDKISDDRTLLEKAHFFRQKTREAGVLFIVNNRLDIALLADADGLHVGNTDIPAEEARKLAPDMLIGVSANKEEQAAAAAARGASYFNIGPLFHTETKQKLTSFLGIDAVRQFAAKSDLPFTVMGGIKYDHLGELKQAGARRIAVVSALTQAEDIAETTRRWVEKISSA